MGLRIAIRRLLRSGPFTLTGIAVLGLGLGVNIVLFETAYALLLRPLAFPNSDRLFTLSTRSAAGDTTTALTGRDAAILAQTENVAAAGITGRRRQISLSDPRNPTVAPVEIASASVSAGYLRSLGVTALAGKLFEPEDDRTADSTPEQSALLTEAAWRSRFGANPGILGTRLLLRDATRQFPIRITGIVAGSRTLPFAPDAGLLLPIAASSPRITQNAGDAVYRSVVLLKPGVTLAAATEQLRGGLLAAEPARKDVHWLTPLRDALAPSGSSPVFLLVAAGVLLLGLTVSNVASLFAARSFSLERETSIQAALGAGWRDLLATYFQESLLISAAGTLLAFLLETWLRPLIPVFLPAVRNLGVELLIPGPALLMVAALLCLLTAMLVSLACASRLPQRRLAAVLAYRDQVTPGSGRLRARLTALQLGLVMVLLSVAGMVGRSFLSALRTSPGLDPDNVVAFQASLPPVSSRSLPAIAALAAEIAPTPGVLAVTYSAELPIGTPAYSTTTAAHTRPFEPADPMIAYRLIGPTYFQTLRIPLAAGQAIGDTEMEKPVAVLNESAANLLFPGGSAIGRQIHSGFMDRRSTVIGVVRDVRTEGLDQPPVPMVYLPYMPGMGLRFLVRTSLPVDAIMPALRARPAASGAAFHRFQALPGIVNDTVHDRRTSALLSGGFALLGLLISSIGLYGVLASAVRERRREIGIRLALGATPADIIPAILKRGVRILAAGSAAGAAGSLAAAYLIRNQLHGVSPIDPVSFAVALLILSAAALTACAIPARAASKVDPVRALNLQ